MKSLLITWTLFIGLIATAYSQNDYNAVVEQLKKLKDEYGEPAILPKKGETLTLIYVPGTEDPFSKVYERWKGKSFKKDSKAQVVGGFKQVMPGAVGAPKVEHLSDAMKNRFAKDQLRIAMDFDSNLEQILKLDGYAVIVLKNGTVEVTKLGMDRKKLFESIKPFFNSEGE